MGIDTVVSAGYGFIVEPDDKGPTNNEDLKLYVYKNYEGISVMEDAYSTDTDLFVCVTDSIKKLLSVNTRGHGVLPDDFSVDTFPKDKLEPIKDFLEGHGLVCTAIGKYVFHYFF